MTIIEQLPQLFEKHRLTNYTVKLVGVRGYAIDQGLERDNQLGIYDDAIIRVLGSDVTTFQASTDPGRYYVTHPINPSGCAQLRPGVWWYRAGLHRGKYPAFVQAEEVQVARLSEEGTIVKFDCGMFGINIHSGGTEEEVGRFSAGCQIIHCEDEPWGENWKNFYQPTVAAMAAYGQKTLPYLLVDLSPLKP